MPLRSSDVTSASHGPDEDKFTPLRPDLYTMAFCTDAALEQLQIAITVLDAAVASEPAWMKRHGADTVMHLQCKRLAFLVTLLNPVPQPPARQPVSRCRRWLRAVPITFQFMRKGGNAVP